MLIKICTNNLREMPFWLNKNEYINRHISTILNDPLLTWRSHSYSTIFLRVKNTFLTKYICTRSSGRTWRAMACPKLSAETYQEWAFRSWRTGAWCREIFPNPLVGRICLSSSNKWKYFLRNIFFSNVPVTWLVMIQTIQRVQSEQNNYITILEVKRCSFVPHRSTIHTGPTAPNNRRNSISETAVYVDHGAAWNDPESVHDLKGKAAFSDGRRGVTAPGWCHRYK